MKLGSRILLVFALLLGVLMATLGLLSSRLVLGEFDRIERDLAVRRGEDVLLAVAVRQRQLAASVSDWANWDAMVQFVQDRNPQFQTENLVPKALVDLAIDTLLILDPAGALVWGQSLGGDPTVFVPPHESLLTRARASHDLLAVEEDSPARTGLVRAEEDLILMLAIAPILSSDGEGPAYGSVLMGARLDSAWLTALAADLELDLAQLPPDRGPEFPAEGAVSVCLLNRQTLQVCALLRDLGGKPLLVIQASLPRSIHDQGRRAVILFGGLILLSVALFSGLFFLILNRLVVSRVERLGREVLRMADGQQADDAIALPGRDELSRLAEDINRLLAHREDTRKTLLASRQQYETLFHHLLNGFAHHEILCDPQGRPVDYRFLSVNPAYERMTGLRGADLVGHTLLEVLPGIEPFWIETFGRVALTGESIQFEQYTAALDKHFEVSAFQPAPGQFACLISEVTERKRSEARIQELLAETVQARSALLGILEDQQRAEEERARLHVRFRALIERAPDGIVLVSREGRMIFASPSARRMFGFGLEADLVAQVDPNTFTHPDDRPRVMEALQQLMREPGRVGTLEYRFRTHDGDWIWVESIFSNLLDVPGVDAIVINFRNIQDRKRAEEDREAMRTQLLQSQKMESVGRLAGGVAHDFNNMLQTILGYVELLQMQVGPTGSIHAELEEIRKAAQRSADLTRQLLAFARKQTAVLRVIDFNQTVGGMINMLRRLLGEDVALVWTPGPGRMVVNMDPSQIDQILVNLTLNARDAIHGAGQITLDTSLAFFRASDPGRPPELNPGDYVLLQVADTGCGMTDAVLANMFEPFFTTKPMGKGTGLGLPTVYGIVKQNGGEIIVRSKVGEGSIFSVYLPRHVEAPGAEVAAESDARRALPCGTESVLVAEDEEAIRKTLRRYFASLGYTVQTFGDPAEALAAARAPGADFALLVSDVIMPGMNGGELARAVKQVLPSIRCLFISGYPDDVIAQRGILEDGVAFLHKPFALEQLAETVRDVLDGTI